MMQRSSGDSLYEAGYQVIRQKISIRQMQKCDKGRKEGRRKRTHAEGRKGGRRANKGERTQGPQSLDEAFRSRTQIDQPLLTLLSSPD
eukprot:757725-Hanusia_phi.AAC.8